MASLEERAKAFSKRVYSHQLSDPERRKKYRSFLFGMKALRWITQDGARADFLETYYAYMRHLDDVIDGDTSLPQEYASREEFVKRRIALATPLALPEEDADAALGYCNVLAQKGLKLDFYA